MASLENQSVSSSYEQLLHVDRDGGGNGTTHVAVKDGDNGTTFPITLATDAIMITSTNRLEFGDNGTFIHQSADGVLDLVSDTTLELNGASGSMKIDTNSRISLSNNDSGTSNTVFGKLAGDDLTSGGNYNSLFGDNTGGNTTGDYNVAIGMQALKSLPDGDKNVAIGVNAMEAQDDTANGLNDCVAIGFEAFQGTNAGTSAPSGTVAIGSQSLKALTSGAGNTAVGFEALKTISSGTTSTAVGYEALELATGSSNTAIGYEAGNVISTGIECTILGGFSNPSANNASNETVVGSGITGNGTNTVTLGNTSVTAVYMAKDSGAVVHCSGVNFPDTQVASGDANTLDDYEEGTYTPVVSNGSSNYSASVEAGFYTKIGQEVFVQVNITSSEAGSGGVLQVTLPFNYNGASNKYITSSVRYGGLDLDSNCVQLMLANSASGTSNLLFFSQQRDNNTQLNLSADAYSSGDTIQFNAHYKVA